MIWLKALLGWFGGFLFILISVVLLVLYFRGAFRSHRQYRLINLPAPGTSKLVYAIANLSDSYLSQGEITDFWVRAEQIFSARLAAIRSAQNLIQFETFIMTPGRRADELAKAICEKARSGVIVQVLVDSYGASSLPHFYWQNLRSAGVEVRFFNRFSARSPVDYLERNHRKLLLIDQRIVLIGGAGISDNWDGLKKIGDTAPWLDYEVCLQGAIVARLQGLFAQHWLDAGGTADFSKVTLVPNEDNRPTILITPGEDPTYRSSSIRALYQTLIQSARKRVWIASPYFLPNPDTYQILCNLRRQGIDLRILTMGWHTDKRFVYHACRENYGNLLHAGIKIYEYQPSMMHAKLILIDNHWVSFGSANFDPRSFFQNDELNFSLSDRQFAQRIEQFLLEAFFHSRILSFKSWQQRFWWQRLSGRFWLLFYWQL